MADSAGASDGEVRIDRAWRYQLSKLLEEEPVADTLEETLQPLGSPEVNAIAGADAIDVPMLQDVVAGQRDEWVRTQKLERLGLEMAFMPFALAIYVYTLAFPVVYKVINMIMFNPGRRVKTDSYKVSPALRASMPYIKFLDTALERLPERFWFKGVVQRGVKWVFPSPDDHDPAKHFKVGARLLWYEFKSTSTKQEVMTRDEFCGFGPGPRTISTVEACRGYDITEFSCFGDDEGEVAFRPLEEMEVTSVIKNIIDPKETSRMEKSGFPDCVLLKQVDRSSTSTGAVSAAGAANTAGGPAAANAAAKAAGGYTSVSPPAAALEDKARIQKLMQDVLNADKLALVEKEKWFNGPAIRDAEIQVKIAKALFGAAATEADLEEYSKKKAVLHNYLKEGGKHLDMAGYSGTDINDVLKDAAPHFRDLTNIWLGNTKVTDAGVKEITRNCKNMDVIYLSHCDGVTETCAMDISREFPNLHEFHLPLSITDEGLKEVAAHCKNLNVINLHSTKVTDGGLKEVAVHCKQLEIIDVRNTKVTYVGVRELRKMLPGCRVIT